MAVRSRKSTKKQTDILTKEKNNFSIEDNHIDKPQKKSSRDGKRFLYFSILFCIAAGSGWLHYQHLTALIENERFFSHLSELEREMSFRTEMGFYYSYFKTLVQAPSLADGLRSVTSDNLTEFPDTINALERFNLAPEVVLAAIFRMVVPLAARAGVGHRQCFTINRGDEVPPVEACQGLAVPTNFYVNGVFLLNGLYLSIFFLLATFLSGNLYGGILGVLFFFYNHSELTRVMWTPPLRESFAVPFLYLQLMTFIFLIRKRKSGPFWSVLLSIPTVLFMLPWQFSQFVILTQCLALGGLFALNLITVGVFSTLIGGISLGFLSNVLLQFGNAMLLSSYLPSCLVGMWVLLWLQKMGLFGLIHSYPISVALHLVLMVGLAVCFKFLFAHLLGYQDDAHIGGLLLSKFTSYKDFHTQMYSCAAEFDFMEVDLIGKLSLTLVLPLGVSTILVILRKIIPPLVFGQNTQPKDTAHIAELLYLVVQFAAFAVMAILIMRLKLFFTPYLCLLATLLTSQKVMDFLRPKWRLLLCVALAVSTSWQGVLNLRDQWDIFGEYSDIQQEELINWIKHQTPPGTVFAGAMPITATVLLTTGRPVVNHPHYEHSKVRRRTELVYQIYSRKSPEEIHSTLKSLKVEMVIVEDSWCYNRYKPGCAMYEVWDVIDSKNRGRTVFCDAIRNNVPKPFKLMFSNQNYLVLKI